MNKFINIRDGRISITSYRIADGRATTLDDLITRAVAGAGDYLTADFSTDGLCKHPEACAFLTKCGASCGNHRGGEVVVLDWIVFVIYADNTVVVDNA